jgi:hypothetical protein
MPRVATAIGQIASERRYLGASYTGTTYDRDRRSTAGRPNATALRKSNSALTDLQLRRQGPAVAERAVRDRHRECERCTGVLDASDRDSTNFSYDAQGLLRQKITVRGASADRLAGAAPTSSEVVGLPVRRHGSSAERAEPRMSRHRGDAGSADRPDRLRGVGGWRTTARRCCRRLCVCRQRRTRSG